MTSIDQEQFISSEQLRQLEKFILMHYELNINIEGIEAITHLLERMRKLQEEISGLKNKINFFAVPGSSFFEE
jgi:hypothetical protein